jgi:diguanylate cyclase
MSKEPDNQDERLDALVEAIVKVADGDLSIRVEPSAARDQVDAVITGFNLMTAELQSVHGELEERVRSRTAMLHAANHTMERMALTDALTSLDNRTSLALSIDRALADAADGGLPPALLLLDLDSFKGVNDTLGHSAGDDVLKTMSQRLRRAVREGDVVARLGGDEFAVLLPGATLGRARRVATRIVNALNEGVSLHARDHYFGVSVGITLANAGMSAEELMMQADLAMYAAKTDDHASIRVYEPVLLYSRRLRTIMAAELRAAIEQDQLVLHFQPVVELATGRIEGVEALVRWNHPVRGLLMPDDFIPLAEETGSITDLGAWVLRAALTELKTWQATLELDHRFTVRINISAQELQRLDMIDDVRAILHEFGVSPSRLIFELTETALVTGNELDTYSLRGLHNLGVRLEIDDFGTGYSSISYLRRLPMDVVKVDRSLIGDVASDTAQQEFVSAVLALIHACGMEAVIEGVETREQADVLLRLGCVSGQGYYFSRPVPSEQITALLEADTFTRRHP